MMLFTKYTSCVMLMLKQLGQSFSDSGKIGVVEENQGVNKLASIERSHYNNAGLP